MNVSAAEKNIGIETFFTPLKGIDGKLRNIPKDFTVREISHHPVKQESGKFTIAEVTATNWETNLLVRELSNRLHISRQRVGFAGTKDKRAKTTRLMSFYQISPGTLSQVKISDVSIENIYVSDRPVKIGNLFGNEFELTIRDINDDVNERQIQKLTSIILDAGGFPNFYGIQRFGVIRPITHLVGKYMVNGDFENAVMTYVANPIEGENEESYKMRKQLQKTRDFAEALKTYPSQLNFEKAMLNKLIVNADDFVGALKELSKNLLTMFVYAYQSYLFNKMVSERIRLKLPLNQAIVGDVVLPIRKDLIDEQEIPVSEQNIDKVNTQIAKDKALVSSLLFGSDSNFSNGEMGEIEHRIIDDEKNLDPRDFIIPEIPYVSSSGSRRSLLAPLKNLDFNLIDDELHKDKRALTLSFQLRKGCYATSLLREFMKSEDVRNY